MYKFISKISIKFKRIVRLLAGYATNPISLITRKDDGTVLAPAVGDIIEYKDGSRQFVASIEISEDLWDIRFSDGLKTCISKKGRQIKVLSVSKSPQHWPPTDCKVYRDGKVVIPESKFKFWFSK